MSGGTASGIVAGIRIDLQRLHETWMEIVYPRQRDAADTVLGKWTPNTQTGWIAYRLWGALGALLVGILYPLVLLGYVFRAQTSRIDLAAARIGAIGVFVVLVVLWGALSAFARYQFSTSGFIAVLAASVVAVVAGLLAYAFSRVGGRLTTVVFAYPFGVTALLLPPVVAALYSPTLAETVFSRSTAIARWINDNLLDVYNINQRLRRSYDLRGIAHAAMWFAISIPVGWLVGTVVTLANYVRPGR
ncbi:hypothetical protein HLRTI_001629 [Halorhabdus tiamatea SARL4B]|uniref:Conserved hypothetical membrane protein n=1 Tax=Halorhabdus tiamatea SARL4B TaxID=1033806 RepID=F7PG52_9EURY|nr:hypothetical protein [Halorhabdus tiamatea]ERJ06284.1 hypothetical protein HLRTI_001629 [Halorhabdus tiamatea SARL4B]CCQ34663.1 conserved hypothetical membrane protein [Halorhabdus tiamatea SARL4B]